MKKRFFVLFILFALLCGLVACSKEDSLYNLLLRGEWSTGDGEHILRFYADGTGMQYYQNSGDTGTNFIFCWELHGNKLKLQEIVEDNDDFDYNEDFESYTIINYTPYTVDLQEENGIVTVTLFLKNV